MFVLLLSGKGLNHVWKGVGVPGSCQHTLPFLTVSAPPPTPTSHGLRRFQYTCTYMLFTYFLHVNNVDNISMTVVFLQSDNVLTRLFQVCIEIVSFFVSENNR